MRERTRSLLLAVAASAPPSPLPRRRAPRPGRRLAGRLSRHLRGAARRHVGALLPARRATTRSRCSIPTALSCAEASDLFRQFLEDWDGRLPRPWVVNAASTRTFTRGAAARSASASPRPAAAEAEAAAVTTRTAPPARAPSRCSTTTASAPSSIPKGNYRVTLLVGRPDHLLAGLRLLRALPPGLRRRPARAVVPRPGDRLVHARQSATSASASRSWSGPPHPSGGGSGTHPTGNRCPGTFRVLNNDSIGKLRLRKGPYRITLVGRGSPASAPRSCSRSFLQDFEGDASAALEC